ncbi:Arm DNA-binding domain-containing protein [Nitrosomonas sp. Is37]|uniref:Arm DNA-binding domain-containing protein n=1 Tax=Nitrosomonas sp. Is37 TaxID=3080535 RepID=UPI003982325F
MAREVKKLKAVQINSLPPGTHSDGGNLLLRVRESGSRSWVFRYKQNGRPIELGLGSTNVEPWQKHVKQPMTCVVQSCTDNHLKKYCG